MGHAEFLKALESYTRVALDSNGAIYYLNEEDRRHSLVRGLFARGSQGLIEIALSGLTEMEMLVHPLRSGNMLERRRLLTVTEATRGVHVTAVSRAVLLAAADVRAKTNLKTPDAVVAGSAIVAGCGAIVGNDKSFERLARVDKDAWVMFDSRVNPVPAYVHLDDFVD